MTKVSGSRGEPERRIMIRAKEARELVKHIYIVRGNKTTVNVTQGYW